MELACSAQQRSQSNEKFERLKVEWELFKVVVIICRKQLCGPGDTIQSYNHQTYHKPQQIQKLSNNHQGSHEDDIDVGKAGDEVIKLEGKMMMMISR